LVIIIRLIPLRRTTGNKKIPGIIAYLGSLYASHFFSFLNIAIHDSLLFSSHLENILTFLVLASSLSLFITVPWFIHALFPAKWTRIVHLILTVFCMVLFIIGLILFDPPVVFTIGVHSLLIVLGGYALIHGFLISLHIPRKKLVGSRELQYSLVALFAFLISVPFMFPGDYTLMTLGTGDSRFYFFPFHAMMVITGFFVISLKQGGNWISSSELQPERITQVMEPSLADVMNEYGLTKREGQIYLLLIRQESYKDIALALGISVPTAKTHILNLYRKLGINKKSELLSLSMVDRPDS
jgi:DNA-binding CsgD family transcriptional regulator